MRRSPKFLNKSERANLAAALIYRRKLDRLRLSNEQLGEHFGVGHSYISRFERKLFDDEETPAE